MQSFADARHVMVDCQLRTYDVTDRAVLAAADHVPRELFVPPAARHLAYLDQAVPLQGTSRSLMAPMVVARMLQFLAVKPSEAALEYAGGSGYGAALMARIGASATLWEPDEAARALARQAAAEAGLHVAIADKRPPAASFDAVLVGGACENAPDSLFGLLRDGGRMIAAVGIGRAARVTLFQKTGSVVTGRPVFDAAAPALEEFRKKPEFVF